MNTLRERLEHDSYLDVVLLRKPSGRQGLAQWTEAETELSQDYDDQVYLTTFPEPSNGKNAISIPFRTTLNIMVVDRNRVVRWHSDSMTGIFSGQLVDFGVSLNDALEFAKNL